MDLKKVGELILSLRTEKKMTQKQLAEQMNISDKTISKWECGRGAPDVSLLPELSSILGVNIEKILLGDLDQNQTTGGNMKNIKFYVCQDCKNIITSSSDSDISCCGRKLSPLVAKKSDSLHNLSIEIIEDEYYITFTHPMTKSHYISFIAYVSGDKLLMVRLYPEQSPEIRIPMLYGGKFYFYCTEDGFFEYKK